MKNKLSIDTSTYTTANSTSAGSLKRNSRNHLNNKHQIQSTSQSRNSRKKNPMAHNNDQYQSMNYNQYDTKSMTTTNDGTNAENRREDNSIKRVMNFVEKRFVGNRTSYICKWTNCGYESLRSDSIVRHIRSRM